MSDPNANQPPENEAPHIAQLRADAESGRIAAAERDRLTRELAFTKAGLDTSSTLGQMVMMKHADGELTAEAIAATRTAVESELGLKPAETPDPATVPGTPEHQLAQAQGALNTGGAPAPNLPPPAKPGTEKALDIYQDALKKGIPQEEAREAGIASLIISAQEGDESTKYSETKWMEERERHGHGAELTHLPDKVLTPNPLEPLRNR